MAKKKNDNGQTFALIAIVAIVAIVGLLSLAMMNGRTGAAAPTASFELSDENAVGDAVGKDVSDCQLRCERAGINPAICFNKCLGL